MVEGEGGCQARDWVLHGHACVGMRCKWWRTRMVVDADGGGCGWWWMQMVVDADGGGCRWWTRMVNVGVRVCWHADTDHQQITLPSGRTVGTVESCGELWRAVQLKCFADMMVVDVDETRVSVNI